MLSTCEWKITFFTLLSNALFIFYIKSNGALRLQLFQPCLILYNSSCCRNRSVNSTNRSNIYGKQTSHLQYRNSSNIYRKQSFLLRKHAFHLQIMPSFLLKQSPAWETALVHGFRNELKSSQTDSYSRQIESTFYVQVRYCCKRVILLSLGLTNCY